MRDGSELVGWGVATGMWDAHVHEDGGARAARLPTAGSRSPAPTSDIGTGTYTVMTQVASDTLGIAVDRITVRLGDSDLPSAPVEGRLVGGGLGRRRGAARLPGARREALQGGGARSRPSRSATPSSTTSSFATAACG